MRDGQNETIILFINEGTYVCSVTTAYTHKTIKCHPLTTTLGHSKSMQCNFDSCSFNYKSDYDNMENCL